MDYPTKHLEELLSPVGRDRGKNAKLVSATFLFQPYVYEFRITAHNELSQLSKSLQIVKKNDFDYLRSNISRWHVVLHNKEIIFTSEGEIGKDSFSRNQ